MGEAVRWAPIPAEASPPVAVVTDELFDAARVLALLCDELEHLHGELLRAASELPSFALAIRGAPPVAHLAENELTRALALTTQSLTNARSIASAVRQAADGYVVVEQLIGGWAGMLYAAVLGVPPTLATTAGVATAGAPTLGPGQGLIDPRSWFSSPEVVALIRQLVAGSDEALLAAVGVPLPWAALLGDDGLGLVGLGTVATLVGAAGAGLGLVRETPVAIAASRTVSPVAAPTGVTERIDRIPAPERDGGQIRVDVFERPDGTRYAEVSIAGTQEFNPLVTDEPFDMSSNIANAIGDRSGSVRAVEEAMAAAGIDATTPVVLVGHSQGGAIAARIAESGDYTVVGLLTFGAPTGQIPVPESVPTVMVEHLDDVVPAFGGEQDNRHAVLVQPRAYPSGQLPADGVLPPHELTAYRQTAVRLDDEGSAALRDTMHSIDAWADGATPVSSRVYDVERVSATTWLPRSADG